MKRNGNSRCVRTSCICIEKLSGLSPAESSLPPFSFTAAATWEHISPCPGKCIPGCLPSSPPAIFSWGYSLTYAPFCTLVAVALQRSERPMLLIRSHPECSLCGWNVDWPLLHLEGLGWVVSCGLVWASVLVPETFQGHLYRHPVGLCLTLKPFISS